MRGFGGCALACGLALLVGCGSTDTNAELSALLDEAEAAAEARDAGFFRGLVAEAYADAEGRSRDDLVGLARGYFALNAHVEVIVRVPEITLLGDDAAEMTLEAAVIGRPSGGSVIDSDPGFFKVAVELVKDGSRWQVVGSDWQRVF
jgi:hypothetical protein